MANYSAQKEPEAGEAAATDRGGGAIRLEGVEAAADDDLAVGLDGHGGDCVASGVGIKTKVQRTIGIQAGDASARDAVHGREEFSEDGLAVRLHRDR